MSFLGGIAKSLVNPMTLAQVAMGPAGWASIAMKTIGAAIGQQLIQQVGQKLGLPQSVIGMAQTAFSAATGTRGMPTTIGGAVQQIAKQFNLSPSQQGNLERQSNRMLEQMTKDALEGKNGTNEGPANLKGKKAESFLVMFAKAMGKAMDTKMDKMMDLSKKIDQATTKANDSDGKKGAVTGELTAEMQALGQEVGMISQAVANSIKSMGEAATTLARKG